MNLYVLKLKDWDYDEVYQQVVLAESVHEARQFAARAAKDGRWLNPHKTTYRWISQNRPRVVLKAVRFG